MPAVSLVRALKDTARLIFLDGHAALAKAWAYFAIAVALEAVALHAWIGWDRLHSALESREPLISGAVLLAVLAAGIAKVVGSTAWLRWVIRPDLGVQLQWRRPEWIFLGRCVQLIILYLVLTTIIGILWAMIFQYNDVNNLGQLIVGMPTIFAIFTILAVFISDVFVVSYLAAFFVLSLPAAACGHPSGLFKSWELSGGNTLRLFCAVGLVACFAQGGIFLVEFQAEGFWSPVVIYWAKSMLKFVASLTILTVAGVFFREIVNPPEPATEMNGVN